MSAAARRHLQRGASSRGWQRTPALGRGMLEWMEAAGPDGLDTAAVRDARAQLARNPASLSVRARAKARLRAPTPIRFPSWSSAPRTGPELETGITQRARSGRGWRSSDHLRPLHPGRARRAACRPALPIGTEQLRGPLRRLGRTNPDALRLFVYEADVARRADGSWVLLSDRLDAPARRWLADREPHRGQRGSPSPSPFLELGVRRRRQPLCPLPGTARQPHRLGGAACAPDRRDEVDPRFFSARLSRALSQCRFGRARGRDRARPAPPS